MLSKKNKDDTNKNNNKIVAVTTVITGARHEKHSICFPETDFRNWIPKMDCFSVRVALSVQTSHKVSS